MQGELGHFMDLVATLKQAAGGFVPEVVEAQILNSQQMAGPCERGADALRVIGEDVFAGLGLCSYERPGLGRVFEPSVVSVLGSWVLGIPDHAGPRGLIVVAPFQAADFRLPPRGENGEIHDGLHRNFRSPVAALEVLSQSGEFLFGRSPGAPLGLADQSQLAAGCLSLVDDLRAHWELPYALGGPQNDANPDQVIDYGRGAGTLCAARLHMPNQVRGSKGVRNGLAERMPLQELHMGLFAALPARDSLEGVDIPADQFREGWGVETEAGQLGRIFERDFAVPGPAQGRRAVGKCPAFPMQDLSLAAQPDYRRVSRGAVGLLAYFDRWHDRNSGET